MKLKFFQTQTDFRQWLEENHGWNVTFVENLLLDKILWNEKTV